MQKLVIKWIGIIGVCLLIISTVMPQPGDYYPPEEISADSTIHEAFKKLAPETIYVNSPEQLPQKVETFYYDPDYPDVLYKEEDIHPVQWNYPTGQMHDAFKPGSPSEKTYTDFENRQIKKRYKPNYTLTPTENNQ